MLNKRNYSESSKMQHDDKDDKDDMEYLSAQIVGGLAVIGAVAILLFIVSAIVYWVEI